MIEVKYAELPYIKDALAYEDVIFFATPKPRFTIKAPLIVLLLYVVVVTVNEGTLAGKAWKIGV